MSNQITPIIMPKWGLSMQEGTLSAWHVEEGAEISPGDEIMDVETDKIANAVEAADGGLLRRRVGQEGEVYPVRALLGVMAPDSVSDAEIDAYIADFEVPEIEEEQDTGPVYEFVDLPVGRIRYAARARDGVPVLLLHGFGGDLDNWLFNIDALAETGPVYALDLPGHGQSVKTIDKPGLDIMVEAVIAFLDHMNIDQAHLVGHSMGGLISGRIAIDHPGRAASVTLIGSAGLGDEINAEYVQGFVSAATRRELKPKLKHLFADQSLVNRSMVDDLLKYKRLDGVQSFLEGLSDSLFSGGSQAEQIARGLNTVDCACQVIWGAQDAIIPKTHANAIAGVSVNIIEAAGHMVQMEQASKVNDLIKAQL